MPDAQCPIAQKRNQPSKGSEGEQQVRQQMLRMVLCSSAGVIYSVQFRQLRHAIRDG
jgi:hypothetical protein